MIIDNCFPFATLNMHTNADAVRGRPTLKDVERQFRNGSVRELQKQYQNNAKNTQSKNKIKDTQRYSNEQSYKCTQMNLNELRGNQRNSEERPNSLVSRNFIDKYSDKKRREDIRNHMDAILESFKMANAFPGSRGLGLTSMTMTISVLLIILFTIFNSFFSSLSFVQLSVTSVLFAALCILLVVQHSIYVSTRTLVNSLQNDCDVLEKAVQLSVFVHPNKESHLLEECRSRYAEFLTHQFVEHKPRVRRDREPSRVPVKRLARLLHKSRKIRKRVRNYVMKNVPMSSRMHCFTNKCNFHHEGVKYPKNYHRKRKTASGIGLARWRKLWSRRSLFNLHKRAMNAKLIYYSLLTNRSPQNRCGLSHVYKSLNHRIIHTKFNLSRDVEKNPGPRTAIDPNKTISAPCSQGNIALFGPNAGRQCVAMSLCALIYNHRNSINTPADLVSIMNTGDELYSVLSSLHNQDFLLLTELPRMVTVLETNYQMEYSPSYSGNIHDISSTVDFLYCMPLGNALQILIGENYQSFLLTIQCSTVAIYCYGNGRFRIFDSHARNLSGLPHPQGTCVLLDVPEFNALITYFQTLYDNVTGLFEFRGVRIAELCPQISNAAENPFKSQVHIEQSEVNGKVADDNQQSDKSNISNLNANSSNANGMPLKSCCAMSFYCICFSVIKACGYWNSDTLDSISEHGGIFYTQIIESFNKQHLMINHLPASLQIYDADIRVTLTFDPHTNIVRSIEM